MPQITILGLGPGEWKYLTLEASAALSSHHELWLRTRHHPLVAQMPAHLTIHSFDALYEEAETFAPLYAQIAREVVRLGQRPEGVLYGVPGHPWVGESTVGQIVAMAQAEGLPVRLIEGISFIEPVLSAMGADALDGLQVADATSLVGRYAPPFDPDRPVLLAQIYSRMVASDVKLALLEIYPPEHSVTLVNGAGTEHVGLQTMPLYELDQHSDFAYRSTLWVPPVSRPASLPHLHNIIAHLRSPAGCPWDQEQEHHTLRAAILEEAYEAVDAIDREEWSHLAEELGDLLLLIAMHAQIASESSTFTLGEVVAGLSEKLIRRHPHVFGEAEAAGSGQVLEQWNNIKAAERAGKEQPQDPFDEVALALPALTRAQKIAKRAQGQGWQAEEPQRALARWQNDPQDSDALGQLLLSIAVAARAQHLDAEESLRQATSRLVREVRGQP